MTGPVMLNTGGVSIIFAEPPTRAAIVALAVHLLTHHLDPDGVQEHEKVLAAALRLRESS